MTRRSISVTAQTPDPNVGRSDSEEFYFRQATTGNNFTTLRGLDQNMGLMTWYREIKGITDAAYNAMSGPEQGALMEEHKVWRAVHIHSNNMISDVDVTYEFAADGDINNHNWTAAGRDENPYNILDGDLTPAGSAYPYGRPVNFDNVNWVAQTRQSTDRPSGWGLTSTMRTKGSFAIDLDSKVRTLTGTVTVDDVDGVTTTPFSIDIEVR